MKAFFSIIFFIPLILSAQPFKVKEIKIRNISFNDIKYYDIHTVVVSKKKDGVFIIDSIQLNGITANGLKLSVLGRNIGSKDFVKGDSLLLQCNVPIINSDKKNSVYLFYHYTKRPLAKRFVKVEKFKKLNDILIQYNQ